MGESDMKDRLGKLLGKLHPGITINDLPEKLLHKILYDLSEEMLGLAELADPIKAPSSIFDPSAPDMLGKITACALLLLPRANLGQIVSPRFYGSGVYALYYIGNGSEYSRLANTETPLYIGSAQPKDKYAATLREQGTALWTRLHEHFKSIRNAENIVPGDFEYRYLVVKSGMQKAAEDCLIDYFKPIWNKEFKICYGFGKHGDSATTRGNKRSPWDTMHPGRAWATDTSADQKQAEHILDLVGKHLDSHPPVLKIDFKELLLSV